MKTSLLILPTGTFAQLRTATREMSVLIPPGMPTARGLSKHAQDLRDKAARLLRDAVFVETGAQCFAQCEPGAKPCES